MSQRRVLVIDRDPAFVDLVRRSLEPYGFEVEVAEGAEGLGKRLKPRPALAFIGVELPERAGFEVFSRTKALAKGLPIVLVTGSVAPSDMAMHQKLSVHADEYLDKRGLAEAMLLGAIDRLVKLGPRIHGSEGRTRAARTEASPALRPSHEGGASTAASAAVATMLRAAGLGAEDSAAIARLVDEPEPPAAASGASRQRASSGAETPAVAKLLTTIAGLERKLKAARDTARSSPFSREFLDLREQVEQQEREIVLLREEASARAARTEGTERRMRELTRVLLKAGEESARAAQAERQAQQSRDEALREAEEARAALAKKTQELNAQAAALRAQHATVIESLETRLQQDQQLLAREKQERDEWAAHAQTSLAAVEQRHAFELGRSRERHAAELEEQRRRLQAELQKALAEAATRLATSEEKWKSEVSALRDEHAGDLAALESRHHLAAGEADKLHAARVSRIDQELAAARLAIEELRRDLGGQQQRAEASDAELADARLQIEDLRRELGGRERGAQAKDAELTAAGRQIEELQRELGGREQGDQAKDAELTAARQQIEELRRESGEREKRAKTKDAEIAYARLQVEEVRRELNGREKQAQAKDAELAAARLQIDELRSELTGGQRAAGNATSDGELTAARLQIEELRRELRALEHRAREDQATITSLRGLVVDFSDGLLHPEQDKSK